MQHNLILIRSCCLIWWSLLLQLFLVREKKDSFWGMYICSASLCETVGRFVLVSWFSSWMNYSPFKALETKLIGGVTLNHLCWAALGGGTVKSVFSGRHGNSIFEGQIDRSFAQGWYQLELWVMTFNLGHPASLLAKQDTQVETALYECLTANMGSQGTFPATVPVHSCTISCT